MDNLNLSVREDADNGRPLMYNLKLPVLLVVLGEQMYHKTATPVQKGRKKDLGENITEKLCQIAYRTLSKTLSYSRMIIEIPVYVP